MWSLFSGRRAAAGVLLVLVIPVTSAFGSVTFPVSGTSSLGHPVSFSSTFTISGSTLVLDLVNTSTRASTDAADVLTSFYFDIRSGTSRPALTYAGGSGFVAQARSGTTDLPVVYVPQTFTPASGTASDLAAVNPGDGSWQFKKMDASLAPGLGFGIGTVGNTILGANGFTPQIVGNGTSAINFGIVSGTDIDPTGVLDGKYVVQNRATFSFTGLGGFTEADVVDNVVFGLGTSPDSTFAVSLPEPAAHAFLAAAAAAFAAGHAARRCRLRGGGP